MNIFFQNGRPASGYFGIPEFQLFSVYPIISAGPTPGEKPPRADRIYARRGKIDFDKSGISAIICAGSQSGYDVRTSYE